MLLLLFIQTTETPKDIPAITPSVASAADDPDIAAIADWVQTLYSDIEELKKEGYHKIIKP